MTTPTHAIIWIDHREAKNFVGEHYPELARRIAGVETLDNPSEAQLVALARKFFNLTEETGA
jgi:hypothetical protein